VPAAPSVPAASAAAVAAESAPAAPEAVPAPAPARTPASPAPAAPAAAKPRAVAASAAVAPAATPAAPSAASKHERRAAAAPEAKAGWCVQLGATHDRAEAERIAAKFRAARPRIEQAEVSGERWYRVRAGAFDSKVAAERWLGGMARQTGAKGFVTASR
jgi:cell division septation protein DedD